MFNKITIYLLSQIFKSFLLIFFIFLSIAWILQLTRLITISNFIQLDLFNIFNLSLYLIPNILTIIIPFILIFSLLLCFIKLNRDKELIAMFSLGLELKPLRISILFFTFFLILFYSILNLFFAPLIYEKYKINEYDLRNTINLDRMIFSNFLELDKTTILDFKKNNNAYEDIFISFNDDKENIIYAKKGNIKNINNKYTFQLIDGVKLSLIEEENIEKLEFKNYILEIENKNIPSFNIYDKNTLTFIDDIQSKNYLNLSYKLIDVLILIYIFYFFYKNNLKQFNFNYLNNIFFIISCLSLLIINQILKNGDLLVFVYITIIGILLFFINFLSNIKSRMR